MKKILIVISFLTCLAFAQDVVPVVPEPSSIVHPPSSAPLSPLLLIIAALVPLVIQLVKLTTDKLPRWSLPLIAPLLGVLVDYIGSLISGGAATPVVGALLGLAGVGVRELIDQVGGRIAEHPPSGFGLLLCFALAATGCGTVQVKEGSDPIVVHAQYLAENGLNSVNQFLQWERNHEAAWVKKNPGIHEFAQSLRADRVGEKGLAERQIIELRTLTQQYQADKTAANGDKVTLATATVLNLVNTARAHAGLPPITLPSTQPSVRDLMKPVAPAGN